MKTNIVTICHENGELSFVVVGAMYWFYRQTHKKVKCLTAFPNEALLELEAKKENITFKKVVSWEYGIQNTVHIPWVKSMYIFSFK